MWELGWVREMSWRWIEMDGREMFLGVAFLGFIEELDVEDDDI